MTHAANPPPCARCKSPIEPEDLRCAVCSLPTPPGPVGEVDAAVASVVRCETCGAAVSYAISARAPKCGFCGAVAHIEVPPDPLERAELYLPFRVGPDEAAAALRNWLKSLGFFRPSGLSAEAAPAAVEPLYWVGWSFDADTLVSWTADSNEGARRAPWAPHSGQSPLSMRGVIVSASRGLTRTETDRLAPHYDLVSGRAEIDTADVTVERFDVQRCAARDIVADAVALEARNRAEYWVPGRRLRNLRVAVLPKRLTTRRYAFPVYVLAYRYRDRLYRALVHGQDASCAFGKAPYSVAKIALVALAALAVLAVVLVLSLR